MASQSNGKEDYAPVFWTFFVFRVICAILILKLNLRCILLFLFIPPTFSSFKQPAKRMFKNLWKLILKPHILVFLVVFFVCGSVWGLLESYLFWFLEDLGSTKLTMGISLAVGTTNIKTTTTITTITTITTTTTTNTNTNNLKSIKTNQIKNIVF